MNNGCHTHTHTPREGMLPIYWQSVRTSATFNVQIKNTTTAATRADKDNAKQTLFYGQKQKASAEQNKHTNSRNNTYTTYVSRMRPQKRLQAWPHPAFCYFYMHFISSCVAFCFVLPSVLFCCVFFGISVLFCQGIFL